MKNKSRILVDMGWVFQPFDPDLSQVSIIGVDMYNIALNDFICTDNLLVIQESPFSASKLSDDTHFC